MYIGYKIVKNIDGSYDNGTYVKIADWCNETRKATIVDRGEYYECVAVPAPTFDELKTAKLTELESSFNDRTHGAFTTTQNYLMQFDTSDSLKMQGAIQLMETIGQAEGYLTQANDVTVYYVPIATMKTVLMEMLAAYAACHARKQELRAAINAAQNEEELNAIEITWPV